MKLKEKIKSIPPMYYISFFLPLVIMIVIFGVRKIYPFGDNVYLRSDMYHQYCPFFAELWDKMHNGGSLFYSWETGLGSNFTALYGYYLSSPLNWFIFFFPRKYMIEMMNIIILIKLSLASVTFTYYIHRRFNVRKITVSLFGLFYALSGFTAAYSWNLMWFDCIYLLPLVILGLERLVFEDKGVLYCVTLGLVILSNYYISIMVCIGMVFYFAVLLVTMPVPKKKIAYLQKIGYFSIFSIIAGGLGAALLFPEIYAFKLTASSDFSFPKTLTQYFSAVTVLTRHLMNTEVCIGLEHLPNIYCSVAIFLLYPLYIFNPKINAREKAAKSILLFVFIFAYSFNIPNFIWHGFHYPNSLPARQSFIYIFILLTMCFDAFKDIAECPPSRIVKAYGLFLLYLLWVDHTGGDNMPKYGILYINALFAGLYVAVFLILKKTKLKLPYVIFMLFCVASVECTLNMEETGYSTTGRSYYFKDYNSIEALTGEIEETDTSFYRIAKAFGYRSKNDASWHGFKAGSVFSSTAYAGTTDLFGKLGLEHSMNAYADHGATPFVYSMLSVKYILSNKRLVDDYTLELINTMDGEYLYRAKYTLPVGFMVIPDINEKWTYKNSNPFTVQNSFIVENTGILTTFTRLKCDDTGKEGSTITMLNDGYVYVHVGNKSVKTVTVTIDEETEDFAGINHGRTIDLGWQTEGTVIKLKDKDGEYGLNPMVYTMDQDKFIRAFTKLNEQGLQVTSHSDTKITGTINVTDEGILMFSIPYDPSWTVTVNGTDVDICEVAEAFLGVSLTPGSYNIELNFRPRGTDLGRAISLCSLALLLIICCFYRVGAGKSFIPFMKKKASSPSDEDDEGYDEYDDYEDDDSYEGGNEEYENAEDTSSKYDETEQEEDEEYMEDESDDDDYVYSDNSTNVDSSDNISNKDSSDKKSIDEHIYEMIKQELGETEEIKETEETEDTQ